MEIRNLSHKEWMYLGCCACIWLIALFFLPPNMGSTDVYLFRDAACNFVAGKGFVTASFEQSRSFIPRLYSSYTPGTLWIFIPFAKLFGCGTFVNEIYPRIWALIADVIALLVAMRFTSRGPLRWMFIGLLGLILPFGIMNPEPDRPEEISFVLLALLLLVLRHAPTPKRTIAAGLVGGGAFLVQPFAGVLGVFLIAGWLVVSSFTGAPRNQDDLYVLARPIAGIATRGILAACFFALPVAVTALAFYQQDPCSLKRFWTQATVAGVARDTGYSMGDAQHVARSPVPRVHSSRLEKYQQALAFHKSLGPISLAGTCVAAAVALAWVFLLAYSTGSWRVRFALLVAGFSCFVIPIAVFPFQGNYLTLTRSFFPILLASNWANVRSALRSTAIIPVLLVVNCLAVIPSAGIGVLQLAESRTSFAYARQQADSFRQYLQQHPLKGKVVLVPASHYYFYKNIAGNLYNPSYLSQHEDVRSVGAIVNCYAATKNFQTGTLAIPAFAAQERWKKISASRGSVVVTLFRHQLMSSNWSMDCDHCCPATSRTDSIGCKYRLSCFRIPSLEVPVKWAFSRTELG